MANSNNRGNNSSRENEGNKPGSKSRNVSSGRPQTPDTGGQSGGGTPRTEDRDLNTGGTRGPNKKSR
ncbi:hypothetical protein [Flaviaesturariibacter aridisoli]|uniref:Uncharacterized protein n=1 Tax=Flaviaesturariibacter aridisoli TaxID=2545761 RepID=A0A4R4E3V6_9BACT|nr:hypothetical protein [Flaviaesturariibacter aridisoli]TCZ73360.1 hypothetical protein E0486_06725 [Flaviaesturariibacter aridisoli]